MIPYGRQDIRQEDIDQVVAVLRSDFLTQGPAVPRFEDEVARYCGASHALAMNSATSALHVACLALDLGPGDRLWTAPNTFVASANCALYCGAEVGFVDVDERTYNLCPIALERRLTTAEREGQLPKVVVAVHFAGQSCDMEAIRRLSQRFGFKVIEDASHAIGGRYKDEPIGSGRFSDITVFSFHPVKIVTTAEGGMALTNDAHLFERMALLRSHGITRDPTRMCGASDGGWYYQQVELGFNYRMTELQAALGLSQLNRLDEYVARRHAIARRYHDALEGLPVVRPWQHPDTHSAFHLYPIGIPAGIGRTRGEVFDAMREGGIGVNVHYIPVHTQPYFARLGFACGDYPVAERYYAGAISLPMFPTLTADDQERVTTTLCRAIGR